MITVVGEYPHTEGLLSGRITSPEITLDVRQFSPVHRAFAGMVERLDFDVCEMALATYIQARGAGRPLTLLPVTMVARFQHPYILQTRRRRVTSPQALEGGRVGIRSYSQTTGVWVRGILAHQFGVDLDSIEWVVFEEPHVSGFENPDNVVRAPQDATAAALLDAGEIDAAVVSYGLEGVPDAIPLFEDPGESARQWYRQNGVVQVNHVVSVADDIVKDAPDVIRSLLRMFREGRDAAVSAGSEDGDGMEWVAGVDLLPFGTVAISPAVDLMRSYCIEQGLVGGEVTLDDLVDATVGQLEPA